MAAMKPTAAFKKFEKLKPQKKFFELAKRLERDAAPEDTIVCVRDDEGDLIPVDADAHDHREGKYELYKNGDLYAYTHVEGDDAPKKGSVGAMRDPDGYARAGKIHHEERVLDAQLHANAQLQAELKNERETSRKYREDADKWRDKVMELTEKTSQLVLQTADKDDGMMAIGGLIQQGIAAFQGADFRKELRTRAGAAMRAMPNLSNDELDLLSRFMNRPEFSGMWSAELAAPHDG